MLAYFIYLYMLVYECFANRARGMLDQLPVGNGTICITANFPRVVSAPVVTGRRRRLLVAAAM